MKPGYGTRYIDQARERLRILVEQVSKKAEKTAAASPNSRYRPCFATIEGGRNCVLGW